MHRKINEGNVHSFRGMGEEEEEGEEEEDFGHRNAGPKFFENQEISQYGTIDFVMCP